MKAMGSRLDRAKVATKCVPGQGWVVKTLPPDLEQTSKEAIKIGTRVWVLPLLAHIGTRDGKGLVRFADKEGRMYCVESGMQGDLIIRRCIVLVPIQETSHQIWELMEFRQPELPTPRRTDVKIGSPISWLVHTGCQRTVRHTQWDWKVRCVERANRCWFFWIVPSEGCCLRNGRQLA